MSADGKTLHLVFSGDDSFAVRKATLQLTGEQTRRAERRASPESRRVPPLMTWRLAPMPRDRTIAPSVRSIRSEVGPDVGNAATRAQPLEAPAGLEQVVGVLFLNDASVVVETGIPQLGTFR